MVRETVCVCMLVGVGSEMHKCFLMFEVNLETGLTSSVQNDEGSWTSHNDRAT